MTLSLLPSCDDIAFISYALADDKKLTFEHKTQDKVTFFWQELHFDLTEPRPKTDGTQA